MATRRWFLISWILFGIVGFGGQPRADGPAVAFYGIGQLSGLRTQPASFVRDATQVAGVIHAVGGATTRLCTATSGLCGDTDTAVRWRFDGVAPATLEALPNLAVNTLSTTPQTAYDITADAAFIGSQARTAYSDQARSARGKDNQFDSLPYAKSAEVSQLRL